MNRNNKTKENTPVKKRAVFSGNPNAAKRKTGTLDAKRCDIIFFSQVINNNLCGLQNPDFEVVDTKFCNTFNAIDDVLFFKGS